MQREQRDDDAAWQAIVDNYGDRVLGPDDDPAASQSVTDEALDQADVTDDAVADNADNRDNEMLEADEDDPWDQFVPPVPPPLPRPSVDRLLSWLGVFGSPAVLLAVVVTGVHLPTLIGWFLVGAFVAGFGYLVATMPASPRDPWDDGAQL
ncbi:hypothetical protein ACFQ0K_01205 [Nocardioides caeni]|uniref:Uncharacterized protein n=1 Tax=Nocardioides caeni TaxID=574700 RepID=A0A4V4HLJ9_9ACTN|nr:hypothetical protein [Nocardioides caeni]THV18516.1 hypothetical protein E9934_02550 [Nocardioides caeni]